eukprot:CAMPEP_0206471584 /NCGR_PEP_ID=MMETSP0324_2-20121206/31657_1 /ASSEMBLY_ACC=CAM_ASM_000836 /TAXON_ID=2866 /ORGANISM="Crypthecodinium cohnii, Strain Seligo" /LENGTH=370 /DNA_ID=CAMNT_0053945951 /DNA_START=100 /DNA_END=1212 /DNA_ORIENTATION=+
MANEQVFEGIVKSFNPQKGWGFIECDASKAQYGSDIFLMKSALNGYCVTPGEKVQFNAVSGNKGTQASNVKVLSPPEDCTFYGEVKTWNPSKGFGFITSPPTQNLYGKDIFALKSEFGQSAPTAGAQCTFKVRTGERGPVAHSISLTQTPAAPAAPVMNVATIGAWPGNQMGPWNSMPGMEPSTIGGWGAAGSMPGWAGGGGVSGWNPAAQAMPVKVPNENETYFGTLKAVNPEKGWGHIDCQATHKLYNKDIFVMRSALDGCTVAPGDLVAFCVTQGAKGPHATNVRSAVGANSGQVYSGKVKSFNETKGWGFIECQGTPTVFGADVFMHKRDFADGAIPSTGEPVSYTVDISSGRAVAKNVRGTGGRA